MHKRTITFQGRSHEVTYTYDEGRYLDIKECKPPVQDDYHDELCEIVNYDHFADEEAYWRQLYEGEKQAGLLPASHYRD